MASTKHVEVTEKWLETLRRKGEFQLGFRIGRLQAGQRLRAFVDDDYEMVVTFGEPRARVSGYEMWKVRIDEDE